MQSLRQFLSQWLEKVQTSTPVDVENIRQTLDRSSLVELPDALQQLQLQAIRQLPLPAPYLREIDQSCLAALEKWRSQGGPNCLVVLTEPVDDTAVILRTVIHQLNLKGQPCHDALVDWLQRPEVHESQLQQTIETALEALPGLETDSPVVAIPALEWCFLRAVEGIEAVEWLLQSLLADRQRFWLIGCNRWSWHYLNRTCSIGACCPQPLSLPQLSPADLKQWLGKLDCQICFWVQSPGDPESSAADDLAAPWESVAEQTYFEALARNAFGNAAVAGRLWVRSQHIPAEEKPLEGSSAAEEIYWMPPMTPTARDITTADRHLLFSLLLHGSLSLSHLATSLAAEPAQVQAQGHRLHQQKLVEIIGEQMAVNPAFYPGLRSNLKQNNFYIGGDLP